MIRLLLAGLAATMLAGGSAAQTIALTGGTVIDGTGRPAIANGVVVVRGDRLHCVGTAEQCPVPAGATRVDLTGRFLTPGLVDAHVHFSQTGWVDGRPDGLNAPGIYPYPATARALRANPARWYRSYLCSGITAVFDVGGHPWTTALPANFIRLGGAKRSGVKLCRSSGSQARTWPARRIDWPDCISRGYFAACSRPFWACAISGQTSASIAK